MAFIKDLLVRIKGDAKPLQKETKKAEGTLNSFSKKTKSIGSKMGSAFKTLGVAVAATFAIKALSRFASQSVKLYDTQIKALTKVETAVKATGGAAGLTTKELAATAAELQKITTFGDEEILGNVTAQLLTFTNIGNEQFKRTQLAALDLATMLDGDLKSATIQLGKALNDPVTNLSALSRSGIQFSDSQKETIKKLAETNQLASAQTIILDELNKQYGGQAEAQAKIGLGPWKQIGNTIGDMREEMGKNMMPLITKFGTLVAGVLPKISEAFGKARASIRRVANGFIDVYNQSSILRVSIGLVASTFKTSFAVIKLAIQSVFTPLKMIGQIIGAVLTGQFKKIPGIIKDSFSKTVDNYKSFGKKAVDNYSGAIKKARNNFIKPLKPNNNDTADVADKFGKLGKNAGKSFADGISSEKQRARDQILSLLEIDAEIKSKAKKFGEDIQRAINIWGGGKKVTKPKSLGPKKDIPVEPADYSEGMVEGSLMAASFQDAISDLTSEGSFMVEGLSAAFDELGTSIHDSFSEVASGEKTIGQAIAATSKKIVGAFIAQGVAAVIANTLKTMSGVLGPLAIPIAAAAGSAASALFNAAIPSFAAGGFVSSPTLAMVGDNPSGRGEYIIPAEKFDNRGGKLSVEVSRRGMRFTLDEEDGFLSRT